jgi:hypothetical protein
VCVRFAAERLVKMKDKGYIEIKEVNVHEDSRSCNLCGKSNYKDDMRISKIGVYNWLNQGLCFSLCDDCLNELYTSLGGYIKLGISYPDSLD